MRHEGRYQEAVWKVEGSGFPEPFYLAQASLALRLPLPIRLIMRIRL